MPLNENLKKLSILIVTYKGDELLSNCLKSLNRTCGNLPEIVVVDNSENISTKKIVSAYSSAKYIPSKENLGFAGGNNLGLPHCTRPYILLLNNDTIIHEEPFSQLIDYLDEHNNVAVVQGKMRLVRQGEILDSCGAKLTPIGELAFLFNRAPISKRTFTRPIFAAKGACLLFKKEIIQKIGGFLFYDHFNSYYEDVDFSHRVWLTGYEVHFVDTHPIDHLLGATASKINKDKVFAQCLANANFSLSVSLGFWGKLLIAFPRKIFFLIWIIGLRIKGADEILSILKAAKNINIQRHSEIKRARQIVQQCRRVSDFKIFKKICTIPSLKYYYYMIKMSRANCIDQMFWN
jgi:GT2 family glycosyltransferase